MNVSQRVAESKRLQRTHLPERRDQLGMTVREADLSLGLNGAGHGLLDTTHFDTVRFPPPDWALRSFADAAADGTTAYTAYRGGDDVRRICSRSISGLLGIDVDPTLGTSPSRPVLRVPSSRCSAPWSTTVTSSCWPTPEYLFVERMLRFLGAEVVRLPFVTGDEGLQPDLDELERLGHVGIKLFVTSNPHNPTGTVLSPQVIERLARIAVQNDFLVLVDELYCRLVYDDVPYTHLAARPGMDDRTITLLGGSKTESLSGFRVGVVVSSAPSSTPSNRPWRCSACARRRTPSTC